LKKRGRGTPRNRNRKKRGSGKKAPDDRKRNRPCYVRAVVREDFEWGTMKKERSQELFCVPSKGGQQKDRGGTQTKCREVWNDDKSKERTVKGDGKYSKKTRAERSSNGVGAGGWEHSLRGRDGPLGEV